MSLELAHTIFNAGSHYEENVPDGWKYLGCGVSRVAYLGPDGMVYKVGNRQCNDSEAKAAAWFKDKFGPIPGTLIPDFIHHDEVGTPQQSVIETVYLPPDETYDSEDMSRRRRWFIRKLMKCGLTDSHGMNIYFYRNLITCVDWGYTDFFYGEAPEES